MYEKDLYMTYIGPTLLVINPYKFVKSYFTPEYLKHLERNAFNPDFQVKQEGNLPHNWTISCNVFVQLFKEDKK